MPISPHRREYSRGPMPIEDRVSVGRCWLVLGGTGSLWGGTGQYLVVQGQYGAVLAGTWWYLISMERYWLELGGT